MYLYNNQVRQLKSPPSYYTGWAIPFAIPPQIQMIRCLCSTITWSRHALMAPPEGVWVGGDAHGMPLAYEVLQDFPQPPLALTKVTVELVYINVIERDVQLRVWKSELGIRLCYAISMQKRKCVAEAGQLLEEPKYLLDSLVVELVLAVCPLVAGERHWIVPVIGTSQQFCESSVPGLQS